MWGLVAAARVARLPRSVWLRTTPNLLTLLSVGGALSLIAGRGPGVYLVAAALVLTLGPMLFSVWGAALRTRAPSGLAASDGPA